MSDRQKAIQAFSAWYEGLKTHKSSGGPARGTIAAALIVLEHLTDNYNLNLEAHRTAGKAQIKGLSSNALAQILARFGETRPFLKEGGRTNRGGPGDIEAMLATLRLLHLESLKVTERNKVLASLQNFLVEKIQEFHNRQRLRVVYDPAKSTWQFINDLLSLARQTGKEGPVAQYLVGAKLQLRFPEIEVSNELSSTADEPSRRSGDFQISDTAFHVTVAPTIPHFDKCKRNVESGLRAYLLVPDRTLLGTRQTAEMILPGKIAVEPIESFVAYNIEELSVFSKNGLVSGFRRLLETYNQRVDEIEVDKSLLIEIPHNLLR